MTLPSFSEAYREAYPTSTPDEAYLAKEKALGLAHFKLNLNLPVTGCDPSDGFETQKASVRVRPYVAYDPYDNKCYDLFYKNVRKDFRKRSQKLIISLNDPTLRLGDYALLMYASYQDEETRANLEGVPVNMLYDIFEPVMMENQRESMKEIITVDYLSLISK
jgi:hypothetical protein